MEEKSLLIYPNMDYKTVTSELFKICNATPEKHVLKLRNTKNILIPVSFLVENEDPYYNIDVATITCFGKLFPTCINSLIE